MAKKICSVVNCSSEVIARGWCHKHYKRWQVHGDPLIVMHNEPKEYQLVRVNGKLKKAHRHILEQHLGRPILPGYVVHHKDTSKLNNSLDNLEEKLKSKHTADHNRRPENTDTHKYCPICKTVLPRTSFHVSKSHADNCSGICGKCFNDRKRNGKSKLSTNSS